jgi:polar amino acid transport system substrate-binding protein
MRTDMKRHLRTVTAASLVLMLPLLASGCSSGSSDESSPASGASADPATESLFDELPEAVQESGTLTIATDGNYAPIASMDTDGTTLIGLDIDLAEALGTALGVTVDVQNASFDAIIPGIQGDKYDAGMSWINDTDERREVVDFVDYSRDGTSLVVLSTLENPPTSLDELCGLTVAVQKGSQGESDAQSKEADCETAGKPVTVSSYPDQGTANVALEGGRAQVTIMDEPTAVDLVETTDGKFATTGESYGKVYHGVAVLKDSGLAEPIAKAFDQIIADGTYAEIFEKWGLSDAEIPAPLINGEPIS